jgi:oligopeptide transport system ATP-binding protein
VRNLSVHYPVRNAHTWPWQTRQTLHAVNGISLDIHPGETLGIVGESGCGKSTLGRALVNLTPTSAGSIRWHGQEMANAPQAAWLPLRRQVQMVFQDPLASLDPRMTVAQIIAEPLRTHHRGMPQSTIDHKVRTTLQRVGLSESHLNRYPHEFSGGQCQRIGIARALILEPELIICDEPVSALDVSIQAQIINLLTSLQNQLGLALLFIAHDLAVVRHISHRVMVMYLGRTMELAPTRHLYQHPRHPYTQALLSAIPIADPVRERHKTIQLLEGDLPSPLHPPSGCVFRTRCPQAQADCAHTVPPLLATHHSASANPNAFAACIHLKADNAAAR